MTEKGRLGSGIIDAGQWGWLFDTAGMTGVALILVAYFLLQRQTLSLDHASYHWMNIGGALLITLSLLHSWNLASFVIEMFWIAISLYGLFKLWQRKKTA